MSARAPISYHVPSFPSLYNPRPGSDHQAYYLYYTSDIWRFTLFWTMILFGGTHLCVAICAAVMQCRSWKVICAVPVLYLVVGALEAVLSGSIVGLVYAFPAVFGHGEYMIRCVASNLQF